jgi:hypothetical protein
MINRFFSTNDPVASLSLPDEQTAHPGELQNSSYRRHRPCMRAHVQLLNTVCMIAVIVAEPVPPVLLQQKNTKMMNAR